MDKIQSAHVASLYYLFIICSFQISSSFNLMAARGVIDGSNFGITILLGGVELVSKALKEPLESS